jgi:hypothetical protein
LYAFNPFRDRDGVKARSVQDTGVRSVTCDYTTTGQLVTGSSIAIYGVMLSTRDNTEEKHFLYITSTDTLSYGGPYLIPPIQFSSSTRNTFHVFNPPVIAPDGFVAQISSAIYSASVFYEYIARSTPTDFYIPRDDEGVKCFDSSLYGVKVGSHVTSGSTGTVDALDFTYGEIVISTWPVMLYGVIAGTGAVSEYVIFEDSDTTTGAKHVLFPPLFYRTTSLAYDGDYYVGEESIRVFSFPWPIRTEYGLTIRNSVNTQRLRLLYRRARRLRN